GKSQGRGSFVSTVADECNDAGCGIAEENRTTPSEKADRSAQSQRGSYRRANADGSVRSGLGNGDGTDRSLGTGVRSPAQDSVLRIPEYPRTERLFPARAPRHPRAPAGPDPSGRTGTNTG